MNDLSENRTPGNVAPSSGFAVPPIQGRYVALRHVTPEDYRFLRIAEMSGELGVRWRYRGATVSPERWAQGMWDSTLAQFIVVGAKEPTPIGLVRAYRANFHDGHAYLAAAKFDSTSRSPLMVLATALFIDYVFTCWDFYKLYFEVTEYNLPQFSSGIGRLFEEEGRLRGHYWYNGKRWDEVLLALYRESWRQQPGKILAAARPAQERVAHIRLPVMREDP